MVSTVSDIQIAKASSTSQVTHLQEMAKKICQEALAETYAQLTPAEQAFQPEQLFQRRDSRCQSGYAGVGCAWYRVGQLAIIYRQPLIGGIL
jgi:hypothetical protein